jgi:hypothetical protein
MPFYKTKNTRFYSHFSLGGLCMKKKHIILIGGFGVIGSILSEGLNS